MPAKSAEQKIMEKQMKAQEKAAREAKIRERANSLVGAAHMVEGFRVMDPESEALLDEILKQYDGNERNHVSIARDLLPRSLQESCQVLYEALIMYGTVSSVLPYGNGAMITLSDSGKNYFINKDAAEKRAEKNVVDVAQTKTNRKQYDVFISHANADKLDYVDELYLAIRKLGISIFYDSEVLSWGDKWKDVILSGTESSEFAIIVISENFFDREWTERELSEFLNRQNESGQKIILPLLHNITVEDLKAKYPDVGDIQCISTNKYSKDQVTVLLAKELIKRYK